MNRPSEIARAVCDMSPRNSNPPRCSLGFLWRSVRAILCPPIEHRRQRREVGDLTWHEQDAADNFLRNRPIGRTGKSLEHRSDDPPVSVHVTPEQQQWGNLVRPPVVGRLEFMATQQRRFGFGPAAK